MTRSDRLVATALFWTMTLLGGSALAASLLLPAWLEYRHSRRALDAVRQRIAHTQDQIRCAQARLEHLKTDPSYLARLARREFGTPIPGTRTVFVYEPPAGTGPGAPPPAAQLQPPAQPATWADALERRLRRDPWLAVFVLPPTRPWVMVFALGLIVSAWLLLPAGRADAPGSRNGPGRPQGDCPAR